MKMLVFYRSRECTNAIVSSAKAQLVNNKNVKGLDVDFINLDKRNYIKVLSQMEELPGFVYIWFDEEKVTDYIHETYPSIEVIHFSPDNSIERHFDSWYGYSTKDYKLADLMIEKFKENLVKKTVYQVSGECKITKENMDDLDIANSSYQIFKTKDEAKQFCMDSLKNDISRLEEKISDYETSIKNCKTSLRKKRSQLCKLTKELEKTK